ncbi:MULTISPECIES: recombinase family protein [Bacillus cereus group]|uniref:recombinase family protein n=1 Tax=Bacillus cereus group TaxID=86661 RepID=UPI001C7336A1|nr:MULTISPECIES: recombinase family protein [Bacillus cereus group]MBX0351300.1 recombinase family protein [Bacillus toyonensis]MDA2027106.1 recombinase family protein [Bacillus cereus group sp. Bcc03]
MKTVAYYRSSIDSQENSIEMQQNSVLTRSIDMALIIDEEYIDEAVSARKVGLKKRPALQKLLRDINNNDVGTVFLFKRDRLARNVMEYYEIYQILRSKKINVILTAPNEPPVYYTPIGEYLELIMAGMAQREGEQIIERLKQTLKSNFQSGKNPGRLPYGYKWNKETKEIELVDEQVQIVKRIYQELASETYESLKELCSVLGLKENGKPWTPTDIRKIALNPTYIGLRTMNIFGEDVTSKYEKLSIIDKDIWEKAYSIVTVLSPPKTNQDYVFEQLLFPLQDLLICSKCQEPLQKVRARKKENLKYKCLHHSSIYVMKDVMELLVFERCKEYFHSLLTSHFHELFDRYEQNTKKQINKKIQAAEDKIQFINEKLITKVDTWYREIDAPYKEQKEIEIIALYDELAKYKKQKEQVMQELSDVKQLRDKVSKYQSSMLLPYDNIKEQLQLNAFFQDLIQQVKTDGKTCEIVFKHPFLRIQEVLTS